MFGAYSGYDWINGTSSYHLFSSTRVSKGHVCPRHWHSICFLGLILAIALFHQGEPTAEISVISALAVLPSLLGMYAGKLVRDKVSEDRFRTWLYIVLIFVALNLIRKGLF